MITMNRSHYRVAEAAKILKISRTSMYDHIQKGNVEVIDDGVMVIDAKELKRFQKEFNRRQKARDEAKW